MIRLSSLLTVAAVATIAGFSHVSFGALSDPLANPGLTGNTQSDVWYDFSSANYPGTGSFPGTSMWSPIASPDAYSGNGDGLLVKVSNGAGGGPYMASSSIYFGGFATGNTYGGTLALTDSTPVSNLQTVAFQIKIGAAALYEFYNDVFPTLTLTFADDSTQTIAATYTTITDQIYNGTVEMPTGTEDIYINTYLLLWDLSEVAGTITNVSVSFDGVQHIQIYGLRLDQSDVDNAAAIYAATVPEPTAIGLLGIGAGAMMLRRRR